MKLTEQIEINKDVIDYINSLTKTGKSLANIIKSEKGDIDKNSLEKLRKNYSRKISKAGYRYNSDLAMYQPKDSSANTNTPNKVDGSKEKQDRPRKRVTKKEKRIRKYTKRKSIIF